MMQIDNQGNIISSDGHRARVRPGAGARPLDPEQRLADPGADPVRAQQKGDVLWQTRMNRQGGHGPRDLPKPGGAHPARQRFAGSRLPVGQHRQRADRTSTTTATGSCWASCGPQNQQNLLVLNNKVLLRERTSFPAISPNLVDNFGAKTPIRVANSREPIYRMQWTGGASTNTGILVGKEIAVRKGVTQLDDLLDRLSSSTATTRSRSAPAAATSCSRSTSRTPRRSSAWSTSAASSR